MCSVTDGDEVAEIRDKISYIDRKCMKCKETAFVVTRINDAFCRECFTVYVVHKFRAVIGKSRLVRDGDIVLLAFSGGPSSTALLHLVLEGLSIRAHKKLRFAPVLLHIDESSVLGLSDTQRDENLSRVIEAMKLCGFPCYISSIDQGLDLAKEESQPLYKQVDETSSLPTLCPDKMADIKSIFSSIKTLTGKEGFLKTLRTQLILTIAKQLGLKKIMTGDTNSRLAVNILSDIVQGRGAQVTFGTDFCDNRYKDMIVLRPMRDLSVKEVAVYNKMNDLNSVFIPTLSTMGSHICSIDRLTENFVTGLQANYFSTISNIVRTGEKLGVSDRSLEADICILCQSPLDTNVPQASAIVAVEFSERLSKEGRGLDIAKETEASELCNSTDGQSSESFDLRKDINKKLCYGCRITFSEINDINKLLPILQEETGQSIRQRMKADIEEYLL